MPTKNPLWKVRLLTFDKKLIFWGSLCVTLSALLPWYQEVDDFTAGVVFYGITGPLYLVGILFLITGAFSLLSIFHYTFREKIQNFGFKLPALSILSGSFLVFLLILVTTVYFHPKFGVSITAKDARFGMLIGFVGAVLLIAGGIFEKRMQRSSITDDEFFGHGEVKPLVEIPDRHQRPITHLLSEDHMPQRLLSEERAGHQYSQPGVQVQSTGHVHSRTIEDAIKQHNSIEQRHLDL